MQEAKALYTLYSTIAMAQRETNPVEVVGA